MNFVIKVADFGLSESIGSKEYFRQDKLTGIKFPIRWLAPESLEDCVFSQKSDVVSVHVPHFNVPVPIHAYAIYIPGKCPYVPKLQVMCEWPWVLTWDTKL